MLHNFSTHMKFFLKERMLWGIKIITIGRQFGGSADTKKSATGCPISLAFRQDCMTEFSGDGAADKMGLSEISVKEVDESCFKHIFVSHYRYPDHVNSSPAMASRLL